MTERATKRERVITAVLAAIIGALLAPAAVAHEEKKSGPETGQSSPQTVNGTQDSRKTDESTAMPGTRGLAMPSMDAVRGHKLFASKGCVACHAVNGVGGHDATPLDAHTMQPMMNPFEFAAKMWRMAPYMIAAQEEALGEQILFSGDELADIIAFVHDDAEQHKFSEADIPPQIMPMMNHVHGQPGNGEKAHGEELGHMHAPGEMHND